MVPGHEEETKEGSYFFNSHRERKKKRKVVDLLVELLEVITQEAKDETEQCRGAYVRLA